MFCPSCKDEFRPGFTRCAGCGVDLVEDLSSPSGAAAAAPSGARPSAAAAAAAAVRGGAPVPTSLRMVDVCGFFDLDEARTARRQLQDEQLHADILIRERGEDEGALQEEYWLRVEATGARAAAAMFPHEEEHPGAGLVCGQCGAEVATDATVCPRCGGRFEEP